MLEWRGLYLTYTLREEENKAFLFTSLRELLDSYSTTSVLQTRNLPDVRHDANMTRVNVPPQPSDRWPESVREAFAEMNRLMDQRDMTSVAGWCDRVIGILRDLEANALNPRTRRQIAYSYFDLTCAYDQLDRTEDARWAYEQARDRWASLVDSSPDDFEALTQLAGCHNHLGLVAMAAREWANAESAFRAALANRNAAAEAHPNHPEQPDNLVYMSGVLCNMGHLFRERGDPDQAIRYYDDAIRSLRAIMPPPHDAQEQEICDQWRNMWTDIYGLPHWARVAEQFLANAQWGKTMATSQGYAGPISSDDRPHD